MKGSVCRHPDQGDLQGILEDPLAPMHRQNISRRRRASCGLRSKWKSSGKLLRTSSGAASQSHPCEPFAAISNWCGIRDMSLGWLVVVVLCLGHVRSESNEVRLSVAEFSELFSAARLHELEEEYATKRRALERAEEALASRESEAARRVEASRREALRRHFPENTHVASHEVRGSVDAKAAAFESRLVVRVFLDEWTTVPLCNESAVTSGWATDRDGVGLSRDDPSTARVVRDGTMSLVTNRSGLYEFRWVTHAHVRVDRALREATCRAASEALARTNDVSKETFAAGDQE